MIEISRSRKERKWAKFAKSFHVKLKTGKFSETKLNFKLKTSNETEKMKNLDRLRLHEFAIPSYIT